MQAVNNVVCILMLINSRWRQIFNFVTRHLFTLFFFRYTGSLERTGQSTERAPFICIVVATWAYGQIYGGGRLAESAQDQILEVGEEIKWQSLCR